MPPKVWAQRIENAVAQGMPDVYLTFPDGNYNWVELKVIEKPVKPSTKWLKIGVQSGQLRLQQQNWHMKAFSMGLRSGILMKADRDLYWCPNRCVARVDQYVADDWAPLYVPSWEQLWENIS